MITLLSDMGWESLKFIAIVVSMGAVMVTMNWPRRGGKDD